MKIKALDLLAIGLFAIIVGYAPFSLMMLVKPLTDWLFYTVQRSPLFGMLVLFVCIAILRFMQRIYGEKSYANQ